VEDRVPKINVYLPDELAEAVKEAGLPVSAVCQQALELAVRRVTAIRESITGDIPDELDVNDPTILIHYTERARQVVRLAIQQAQAEGTPSVGTGHLLGGILAEGGNLALRVLHVLEIDSDVLRQELARRSPGDADATPPEGAGLRFSGPAANALELTATEAYGLGHNYIGCEHLLLGLVGEPDGAAGHALRALGAEQRITRRAVSAALTGFAHLRATQPQPPANAQDPAGAVAEAVRQQLEPIVQRLERLEQKVAAAG
jgi:ATP-dependent Clp protease ATP-binding subunit ClpA